METSITPQLTHELTIQEMEPAIRVLAATSISESLSFNIERKYLQDIQQAKINTFHVKNNGLVEKKDISWVRINQIGRPLEKSAEFCFTAMQKILYSCFLPHEAQLLFLLIGGKDGNSLYIGLRGLESTTYNLCENLCTFIQNGVWPGIQAETLTADDNAIKRFKKNIAEKHQDICAITGIPSMESQYSQLYPATIDMLMAGMSHSDQYAYLVMADPLDSTEVDDMICRCREMSGQAESLKSANISEGISNGSFNSHSKSQKDPIGLTISALTSLGLSSLGVPDGISRVVSEYVPTNTKTTGTNNSHTKNVSRNVVNKHIACAADLLNQQSMRLAKGKATGLWEVGVFLIADNPVVTQSGALQMRSLLSGEESVIEPIRIHDITNTLTNPNERCKSIGEFQSPNLIVYSGNNPYVHPLGKRYMGLTSVVTTKELSYLANFPLRSVPGISVVDSSPEFSLNLPNGEGVNFGYLLYGGTETTLEYRIPPDILSRHVLLSGINGSGKTNTVKAILDTIGTLPFLVIEPAKTEYVDWAIDYNKKHKDSPINIYIPGCKSYKGYNELKKLKVNPFEIVWINPEHEPNVLTHIDRLKSTFAAAFPMYDILPVLMEDLIYFLYRDPTSNWMKEPVFKKTLFPTLNSMKIWVDKVIENHKYEERVSRNMKACLNTRIDSLMRGWKGEMLNTVRSTQWNELFDRPTIINLSYVGDDVDKGFFMSLILQFLYEYRCAQSEQEMQYDGRCKHLTVIEEAHRVMNRCENPEMPQYKTAMMFSNMLSEIRAYGEGFMLVDQVPTRLIPDAIKNTNLKITHRLVSEDDCRAVGESMGLSSEQRMLIPKLLTGQCIVSGSQSTDIYWIKAKKSKT